MRATRLVLPVLVGLVPSLALAGCSDSSEGSAGGPVEVSEVGEGFTFKNLEVADGWTITPVERSAAMESVTSPEIRGEVIQQRTALLTVRELAWADVVDTRSSEIWRTLSLIGRDGTVIRIPVDAHGLDDFLEDARILAVGLHADEDE